MLTLGKAPLTDPLDSETRRIQNRARRQRGCMLIMSLWVLGWLSLFINGLIQYNYWTVPLWGYALFSLVISPFTLIYTAPLSLAGYWVGKLPLWRDHRDYWVLGLPIVAAIAIQIPTTLDRLDPARRFQRLTGVELPRTIHITSYQSRFEGIDFSVHFELSVPHAQLGSFYAKMSELNSAPSPGTPFKKVTHQFKGALLEIEADQATGTMTVRYLDY